jgi:hypothetical protein
VFSVWEQLYQLFTADLHYTASYELWVLHRLGLDYRRRCVAGWSKAVTPAEAMTATWKPLVDGQKTSPTTPEWQGGGEDAATRTR